MPCKSPGSERITLYLSRSKPLLSLKNFCELRYMRGDRSRKGVAYEILYPECLAIHTLADKPLADYRPYESAVCPTSRACHAHAGDGEDHFGVV